MWVSILPSGWAMIMCRCCWFLNFSEACRDRPVEPERFKIMASILPLLNPAMSLILAAVERSLSPRSL